MNRIQFDREVILAPHTSWLVGGPAEFFYQPRSEDDLIEALSQARASRLPVNYLSGGSNVLVSDLGVRGLVIHLGKMSGLQVEEDGSTLRINCLAGTAKSELLKIFLKYRLEPALFLAGLPGDVGGGVVMNAGIGEMLKPCEFVEITDWVEVIRDDLTKVRIQARDLKWSYRHCEGWRPGVISRVGLSWPLVPQDDLLSKVKAANHVRLTKQPLELPSCGSVFVNPPGHKSGQLIESCGLKGYSVGGAQVSPKHANFVVNFNRAKASDIDAVIRHVQSEVLRLKGVELRTEVVYLGEWLCDP